MGTKKTFSKEFKAEAVAMVKQPGMIVGLVAKDLGISQSALRNWYKQDKIDCKSQYAPFRYDEIKSLNFSFTKNRINGYAKPI